MDMNIIRPGDDPLAERPTYTITLTSAEAFAICDAITCLWMAANGDDANTSYREYGEYGFMEEGHAVADRLNALMRPHATRVGVWVRACADVMKRRN